MKKAIYPGSFDPITYGHIDIINRAIKIFDEVIVVVSKNANKKFLLSDEERQTLIQKIFDNQKVKVIIFSGLTTKCALENGASTIIRGLRMITDFEYEFQMNLANKELNKEIDTVFLMTDIEHSYISSSLVKEIHNLAGDISKFAPPAVIELLDSKKKSD